MPVEWRNERLGYHVRALPGFAFPSSGFHESEGLPLVRIRDIGGIATETRFRGPYSAQFLIERGNILIGMDGDFAVHRWAGEPALLNQRVCRITATSNVLDERFVYWLLQPLVEQIHRRTPQTTVRHLSTRTLEHEVVLLPPAGEQRQIAEILDTLDEAIRKTEQIIAKLQQVKQGLLHDLLTRGIDDNGELRDPDRHPEQFKDSPLGRIPKAWNTFRFAERTTDTTLGTAKRGLDPLGDNLHLLKMGNLTWGGLDLGTIELVARARVPGWQPLLLRHGDLLFNTRNTPDLVGKTAAWRGALKDVITDNNILRVRFDELVNGVFLAAYMGAELGRRRIGQLATGTTSVAAVYWRNLSTFLLPLPSRSEQDRIVSLLDAAEHQATAQLAELSKLRLLKSGLMEDLLTGRVRVTKLLEQAAE